MDWKQTRDFYKHLWLKLFYQTKKGLTTKYEHITKSRHCNCRIKKCPCFSKIWLFLVMFGWLFPVVLLFKIARKLLVLSKFI